MLLETAVDIRVNQAMTKTEEKDCTPLIIAAYLGHMDIVTQLLEHADIDTSLCYKNKTALDWCQPNVKIEALNYLDESINEEGRLRIVELFQFTNK